MRFITATLSVVLLCSTPSSWGETLRETLTHQGRTRRYNLYVPSTYSSEQASPLVVNIHGLTGSGPQQMNSSGMNEVAERENFLVAYPSATNGDWSSAADHSVAFFDSLLDTITSAYNIDHTRIYSTGMSQGGIMSYILGVERPDTFAAIASVAGSRPLATQKALFPSNIPHVPDRPLPLLHIHGTADTIVPFEGGNVVFPQFGSVPFPSVEFVLADWLANNNCELDARVTELPDPNPDDQLSVTLNSYENCSTYAGASGAEHLAEIQFYQVNGGEHDWPADSVLDTNTTIWDFFTRHEIPGSGEVGPALHAGDADQDLDFDQLDLVQVQVAAKYLTRDSATWGEGDWDGAPGGSQGNPPPGNGLFDQLDVISALNQGGYLTGPYAALAGVGTEGDDRTSLVYNPGTGDLSVDPPQGSELTSINITSASNKFIGDKPAALDGAFDNFAADNVFKATFGGSFGAISFGRVLPAGLSEADVTADLSAVGSLAGGGDLGAVDLVYIPEPSAFISSCLALLALILVQRRS